MLPLGLGETVFSPDFDLSSMPSIYQKLADKCLSELDVLNTHRQTIADLYYRIFDHDSIIPVPHDAIPSSIRFPLMAGSGLIPPDLKRMGIRRMYPKAVMSEETIAPFLSVDSVPTPGAEKIAQKLITLPTHLDITENTAREIARRVKRHAWD